MLQSINLSDINGYCLIEASVIFQFTDITDKVYSGIAILSTP